MARRSKQLKSQDTVASFHRVPADKQPRDDIFFRKVDIKVGTILLYKGRLAPNARYEVIRIVSDRGFGKGDKTVQMVEKMNDLVHMRCLDYQKFPWMPLTRDGMAFGYLSYSAIWRLE